MTQIKTWILNRAVGDGNSVPWKGEVHNIADQYELRAEDILRTNAPHTAVAITALGPLTPQQALSIHNLNNYEVLAAVYTNSDENGNNAGKPYPNWGPDYQFSDARWNGIRNGLIAIGLEADVIDAWRDNHPTGTPRDFYRGLSAYLGGHPDSDNEGGV